MNAREKVLDVERQVREIVAGQRTEITCPFCGLTTPGGIDMLCCDELSEVVLAVLNHVEFKQQTEVLERVMDRVAAAGCN